MPPEPLSFTIVSMGNNSCLTQGVTHGNNWSVDRMVTTKSFEKALGKLPVNWQKRIVAKIKEVGANPYAPNNNLTKLQGRDGYRLRVGDWRVLYELQDDRLVMLVLKVGPRGGIYRCAWK
jgi:mRNA interferase RelE/StbE